MRDFRGDPTVKWLTSNVGWRLHNEEPELAVGGFGGRANCVGVDVLAAGV